MSTQINQDVIKAREVVAGYKELNKGTKEVLSTYDPILRLRVFKKESIDPRSKEFTKLYGKKEKKEKPVKAVKFVAPNIDKTKKKKAVKKAVSKPVIEKEKPIKVNVTKKHGHFNPNSQTSKTYALHLEKFTNEEIALQLNIPVKRVRVFIATRKNQLGIKDDARRNDTAELIKKHLLEGKTCIETADLVGTSIKNVYEHIYYRNKIDAIQKEIFEIAKKKCKFNGTDYFYTFWVSPLNNTYKSKATKYDIIPRCDEMVVKGLLRDSGEGKKSKLGKKYYINIA